MPLGLRLSTRNKITVARLLNRMLRLVRGDNMVGQFQRRGITWSLDLNEGIDFALFLGVYENELVRTYRKMVLPGSVILDVGANLGAHTLPLARCVGPNGRIVAIEPTEYAMAKLRQNLELNPDLSSRVAPIHAFIVASDAAEGARAVASRWPLSPGLAVDTPLCGFDQPIGAARKTTIDGLVRDLQLPRVDWMKIDVDGYEPDVMAGACATLAKYRPRVLIELAPYCHAGDPGQFDGVVAQFASLGYRFASLPRRRPLPMSGVELRRHHIPTNGSINVIAEPKEPAAGTHAGAGSTHIGQAG